MKKKLVVLSGAGISAESGISTFRDANGLWENHDIMEVASISGWHKNPKLVLEFYNQRRRQLNTVKPNLAHEIISEFESEFEVIVITQNVDDLHERAGSSQVIHLHGELLKASNLSKSAVIPYHGDIKIGQLMPDGTQMRPYIVWFGEDVPMMETAIRHTESADIIILIGTSLQVYPAAGLLHYASKNCEKFVVDPKCKEYDIPDGFMALEENATTGMQKLKDTLISIKSPSRL